MELLPAFRNETAPLPSATVVLLRDGASGLEVFLLRRHAQSDVLGGAYVFPGGKVDAADAQWVDRLDTAPAELQARLGEPDLDAAQAATLFVSAIREVFEETGLLFASLHGEQARQAWRTLRTGVRFSDVLAPLQPRLAAAPLQPWSRWVTPVVSSVSRKRFDTRFFVAAV
ncbi:MAG TPA: NUDIX domain-containing protein, partial [Ramlibacter sp.]